MKSKSGRDTFEIVREILADMLAVDADDITLEKSIKDDLKADSMNVMELIIDIEEEYDIEIPDEVLPNIKTVGDIVSYLDKL